MKKKKPVKKPVTALARRPKAAPPVVAAPMTPMSEVAMAVMQTLPDTPVMLGAFVGKLKLTGEQTKALRRPVEKHEIEWKAAVKDGPPIIPYLSHNGYRDRLDAAFGLGGWGIAPVGAPKEKDETVILPCALYIDGVARIFAYGAQAYRANGNMDWGDCLEGAKSNAIVRCGKELGIARELWNKSYIRQLTPPGGRPQRQQRGPMSQEPSRQTGRDGRENDVISSKWKDKDGKWHAGQRERLWAIIKSSGRTDAEVKAYLAVAYNIDSTTKILRRDYDAICKAVETPGPMRPPDDGAHELEYEREPGSDDE